MKLADLAKYTNTDDITASMDTEVTTVAYRSSTLQHLASCCNVVQPKRDITKQYRLIHVYTYERADIRNLSKWARLRGLKASGLRKVVEGKTRISQGWRLLLDTDVEDLDVQRVRGKWAHNKHHK